MENGLLPFRLGTRQRFAKVGTRAYAANTTLEGLNLPEVGMLSRVYVNYQGTATLSGAGALSNLGPWNLLQRLRLETNIGSASIVDVSGYGAYLAQALIDSLGFRPDLGGVGSAAAHADVYAAPVAMGANTWNLWWILPVSANVGREFDMGMINLQAPETTVTLTLQTGAITDPAALITDQAGTFHVYYEYFEIPDPTKFARPPLTLIRLLEEQRAIGQTGENAFPIQRMGVMLSMVHCVILNGARSDSWDSAEIRFNKTDRIIQQDRRWLRLQERAFYGLNPITGVYTFDFWRSFGAISTGDTRDAIDTEELSTLESILNVSGGAVLGANNNFHRGIRRIVQTLE